MEVVKTLLNAYHAHWLRAYEEAYALENRAVPSFLEIHTTSKCPLAMYCPRFYAQLL